MPKKQKDKQIKANLGFIDLLGNMLKVPIPKKTEKARIKRSKNTQKAIAKKKKG